MTNVGPKKKKIDRDKNLPLFQLEDQLKQSHLHVHQFHEKNTIVFIDLVIEKKE